MSENLSGKDTKNDWIYKESRKRPNQFYYFNVKTGESRWEQPTDLLSSSTAVPSTSCGSPKLSPTKINDRPGSEIVKSFDSSTVRNASNSKERKLSPKSREVKKVKSPAQDHIKRFVSKNKSVVASSIKEVATANNSETRVHHTPSSVKVKTKASKSVQSRLARIPKKLDSVHSPNNKLAVRTNLNNEYNANADKSKVNISKQKPNRLTLTSAKQNKITKTKHSTHKTPAQQRLNELQKQLIKEQLLKESKDDETASTGPHRISASIQPKLLQNVTGSACTDGFIGVDLNLEETDNWKTENAASVVDEEMDWEPSSSQEPQSAPTTNDWSSDDGIGGVEAAVVVPDTNIFLSSLICVKDIIAKEPNYQIKVPYMVLQELDKLKTRENDTVSQMAKRAIHYIYENMKDDNQSRFAGQSATEDCRHLIDIQCPDDKILNFCLQLKESGHHVILLSNDKNLCVKAKVNQVNTLTSRLCNEKYDNEDRLTDLSPITPIKL